TTPELNRLAAAHASAGNSLASITLGRIPDFQANLLARAFLSPEELETYVRNNVFSLADQYAPAQLYQRLARYVYKYSCLALAEVPRPLDYFLGSTFFREQYLEPGVLSVEELERLLATTATILNDHHVDWEKLRPPKPRSRPATPQHA